MVKKLMRCTACGGYTLKPSCPDDGSPTAMPRPAPWSLDRLGHYRREARRAELVAKGLL